MPEPMSLATLYFTPSLQKGHLRDDPVCKVDSIGHAEHIFSRNTQRGIISSVHKRVEPFDKIYNMLASLVKTRNTANSLI